MISVHPLSKLPLNAVAGEFVLCELTRCVMMYDGNRWLPVSGTWGWNLFIDDIRQLHEVDLPDAWLTGSPHVVRTTQAAIDIIETRGLPDRISFDHDLGEDQPPATHIMWHIINGHLDGKWDCGRMKEVIVHSVNTPGAENLLKLWQGFCHAHAIIMPTSWRPALK